MDDSVGLLSEWLAGASIEIAPSALGDAVNYMDCVIEANVRTNVTAVTDAHQALLMHVFDSLLAVPAIHTAPGGAMLDLGTGGGFPGVPCALATGRRTTCLDSVGRKVTLVRECISEALPGQTLIEARAGRSEELALEAPASFAVVLVRAVAELPVLLELGRPLLADGGHLVALKGTPGDEELERADAASEILGMAQVGVTRYRLPEGAGERSIYSYRADRESRVELPRRPGRATKRPLA